MARNSRSDARFSVLAIMALGSSVSIAAFFTPNWLASDTRLYGTEFVKLGLWETCFRSLKGPDDLEFRKYFSGCRWIFREEYQSIRSFLTPGQFFSIMMMFTHAASSLPFFQFMWDAPEFRWCVLRKWKSVRNTSECEWFEVCKFRKEGSRNHVLYSFSTASVSEEQKENEWNPILQIIMCPHPVIINIVIILLSLFIPLLSSFYHMTRSDFIPMKCSLMMILSPFYDAAFFIATQVLYTIGFVFLLLAVIGTLAIELCFITDREAFAMKILATIMFCAGMFETFLTSESFFLFWHEDDVCVKQHHTYFLTTLYLFVSFCLLRL